MYRADHSVDEVLEEYGPYFIWYTMNIGYDRMLRSLGTDFASFIDNLDNIHTMLEVCYDDLRTPQFRSAYLLLLPPGQAAGCVPDLLLLFLSPVVLVYSSFCHVVLAHSCLCQESGHVYLGCICYFTKLITGAILEKYGHI